MTQVTTTRRERWTPKPGQHVWLRTGGSNDIRAEIELEQLDLILPEEGSPTIHLRFEVDLATYLGMEERRWFDIPVGFVAKAGIPLGPHHPIVMEVATRPVERFGIPPTAMLIGVAPADVLATLVAPFLDPELERSVNNPLLYEVVRVSQLGPDGVGPSFDRALIEAWQAR